MVIWNNVAGPFTGDVGPTTPTCCPPRASLRRWPGAGGQAGGGGPVTRRSTVDLLVETRRTWNVIAETNKGRSDTVMAGAHPGAVLDGVEVGAGHHHVVGAASFWSRR